MLIAASTILGVLMAVLMIFIRARASKKPASEAKIILPPLFMSTGAFMFLFPVFQISWAQVVEAFTVGMIFSIFLVKTTKFEVKGNHIYLIPSRAFIGILFALLLLRVVLKLIIGQTISFGETSGMFFILAFGMIVTWRIAMLFKFKKLKKQLDHTTVT